MTIVGPDRWPGSAGLWGRSPRRAAVGYAAGVLLFGLLLAALWSAIVSDANAWYLYALASLLTAGWLAALLQLGRMLRDVTAPTTVEGKVILHEFVEGYDGGEGPSEPDVCRIAVDDGRSDLARAYKVDGRVFAHVRAGDVVRLTAGSNHGYVYAVDMLDGVDGAVGQVGTVPELPGAPLAAMDVSRAVHRVVRSIEGPELSSGDARVHIWTYHLGGDDDSTVRVHLTVGHDGVQVLVGLANRSNRPRVKVAGVGDMAWRFGTLLIATEGDRTVGIEPTDRTFLQSGYVDELARRALDSARSSQRSAT